MKKVFNYRFFCFSAVAVACAVIPCVLSFSLPAVIAVSVCTLLASVGFIFLRASKRTKWTVCSLLIVFAILVTVNYFRILQPKYLPETERARLRFYVTDVSADKEVVGGWFVDLESGMEYKGATFESTYYEDGNEFRAGDVVDIVANVSHIRFRTGESEVISYDFLSGLRYEVTDVEVYALERDAGKLTVSQSVRAYMLERVNELFHGDARGMASALLFGDKSMISHSVKDAMSASGLSHVLAISGLHFSVIAGIVGYIVGKTKAYPRTKIVISTLIMLFYASICDFSPSVTRAFIMISVAGLASFTARRYDVISSACFAVTVSLIISPEQIANLGFLMSYSSVFGIIFLQAPLKRLFGRLPRWAGDFLSVSLSANIGIFPASCQAFGVVSTIFLIANALVLPVMCILYILLLLALVPGAIGAVIGGIANAVLNYVLGVGSIVGSIPGATTAVSSMGTLLIIAYWMAIIYSSEYIFKKKTSNPPVERLENCE